MKEIGTETVLAYGEMTNKNTFAYDQKEHNLCFRRQRKGGRSTAFAPGEDKCSTYRRRCCKMHISSSTWCAKHNSGGKGAPAHRLCTP